MQEKKQRGSGWSLHLAIRLYKLFGYTFLYYLLYPITFFYFVVANNAKKPLRAYYKKLQLPFNNKIYFEHLRIFAVCLTDRFISKIEPESYIFDYEEKNIPRDIVSQGAVLVYSHFGGWAASSTGAHVDNKINIVMQELMLEGVKSFENTLEVKSQLNIIDLNQGTLSVSIQVANALMNNEVVVFMADRSANKKGNMAIPFLGEEANFNKNPFQIAYKTSKPLLAYFIIWTSKQHYTVEYIEIKMDQTKKEKEVVEEALRQYVEKLEEMVKKYPHLWFNFYDFWEKK